MKYLYLFAMLTAVILGTLAWTIHESNANARVQIAEARAAVAQAEAQASMENLEEVLAWSSPYCTGTMLMAAIVLGALLLAVGTKKGGG